MSKTTPPIRGQLVPRRVDDNDDTELPGTGFIDGVLRVFEGVGREHAKFSYVDVGGPKPCTFCAELTSGRLVVTCRGEESRTALCDVCKLGVSNA